MKIETVIETGRRVAVRSPEEDAIDTLSSAMDLIIHVKMVAGADCVAIPKEAVDEGFFDLSSLLAGEVVRKFANYQLRCAIWGDFSGCSADFQAFAQQQNNGWSFFFTETKEQAIARLQG